MSNHHIPVIAIDGPSASGKGTVASLVATRLGFHYLDSGALYRLVAYAAMRANIAADDEAALAQEASGLEAVFESGRVRLQGEDVSDAIRAEACGNLASKIAALPAVRHALLARQRAFRAVPGLVADGRDMGSVVFPDANLKIFLTASAEERANRRYKQLSGKGIAANIAALLQDILERDARDTERRAAPLQKLDDALLLDTTSLTIAEAVERVVAHYQNVENLRKR